MASLIILINIILLYSSVHSEFVNYDTKCKERICIAKCCPENQYINVTDYVGFCIDKHPDDGLREFFKDFADMKVYDEWYYKTSKSVKDTFYIVPSNVVNSTQFSESLDLTQFEYYVFLTVKGEAVFGLDNTYGTTVLNSSNFCVDYTVSSMDQQPQPKIWAHMDSSQDAETNIYFITSALIVSSIFLVLVLVVYGILPELRNLGGLILMAYVASLLGGFLLLAMLQILTVVSLNYPWVCLTYTFLIYFFLLSSFCWMNVMSFDIWWTFRGYAKARPIHRYGERFKFLVYCIYAFGIPLLMTVGLIVLNFINLKAYPFFIQPNIVRNGCFLESGEKLLYLYTPMMILVMSNWMFFLLTAFNLWRLNRATAVLDSAAAGTPAAHRTQRHRLMVYLKLSVIMGVSWVLEAVSFKIPGLKIWYLSDAYNILIGVSIFFIFVCKKKIIRKLLKKYHGYKHSKSLRFSKSQSSATTDSDCDQQDVSLQVCQNPKGYGQYIRQSSFVKGHNGKI